MFIDCLWDTQIGQTIFRYAYDRILISLHCEEIEFMKKALWLLLLLALLLACGPSTTDSQPADANVEDETAVTNTEETADTNDEAPASESAAVAATNLDNFTPAADVAEAAVVREQDWRKGAADPAVVIIEYGDFQ